MATAERGGCKADFTRTCEGCAFVKTEVWLRGRLDYRCMAPGKMQGYVVGIGRYLPYVPAWCPQNKEERK